MSDFERPERPQTLPDPPERLLRLDRELKTERTKSIDYVYAVRKNEFGENYRFKISFVRIRPDYFTATTTINGKVHRRNADTPSTAYCRLIETLSWAVSRMTFEANLSKNLGSAVQA